MRKAGSYRARENEPVTFAEQMALAQWLQNGDPVSDMATRIQRTIPQTRRILFG